MEQTKIEDKSNNFSYEAVLQSQPFIENNTAEHNKNIFNNSSSSQPSLKNRIMASIMSVEDAHGDRDICRVCRLPGDDTLYHPCLCTGSIKYVHQECLLQWLKYSKKDMCELCNHKFSFRPLYRADMPERLLLWDLLKGVFLLLALFMKILLTYTLVATCWLGLVPLMAARTHRMVFSGLFTSFFSSRLLQLFSIENVAIDIARGSLVITLFLCTFISLVWLREQIMIGGPDHFIRLADDKLQPTKVDTAELLLPTRIEHPPENKNNNNTNSQQEENIIVTGEVQNGIQQDKTSTFNNGNINLENIPTTSAAIDHAVNNFSQQQSQNRTTAALTLQRFQPVQAALVVDENPDNEHSPLLLNNEQLQQNETGALAELADAQQQRQRFVDELTWQRLFGLDGSFAFIEHVFWTISLNVVFNIVFLYLPAQIGASVLTLCGFGPGKIYYFELPIFIMFGLLVILLHGLIIHRIAKIFRLKSLYTTAGMICLMLKVFLLVITELIVLPVLCGWWLDICSLPLTGVTLDERIKNFRQYPSSSMFLHWLAGMVYIFYSASFILILRELLRPGVLWFIRNMHDPDFNPIQEMIEQPVIRHMRRLISSLTLFSSIIMLVVYVPLRLIKWLKPTTLPYMFTGSADTPLVEYSFELVLLQIIMPSILEYSKAFSLLKRAVRLWCRIVGGWLQLDSYLLSPEKEQDAADQREQQLQRARERLMRGNQEEQIGLMEALEAIEDDTTEDEDDGDGDRREMGENSSDDNRLLEENNAIAQELLEDDGTLQKSNDQQVSDPTQSSSSHMNYDQNNTLQQTIIAEPQEQQQENGNTNEQHHQQDEQQRLDVQQRLQEQREQRNLGAQHHAMLNFRDPKQSVNYVRPNFFALRIIFLLFFVSLTAQFIALLFFYLPVTVGRTLLSWLALTSQPVHDLYTVAVGLYTCWLIARVAMLSHEWAKKGWTYVKKLFRSVTWLVLRVFAAAIPLVVIIPLMLGFYFQMLVISPLRVAIFQSPLFFPWKEWAMGVVHFKIICASVLMGPDWWLKTAFEQIYADGIWNFRLRDLYLNLVLPIVNALAFLIAFPYVISKFLLLFVEASREDQVVVTRYSYPFLLAFFCIAAFLTWQWQKLKLLAQKIRNDKYLIGTQLVNFYRDPNPIILAPITKPTIAISTTLTTATQTGESVENLALPKEEPQSTEVVFKDTV